MGHGEDFGFILSGMGPLQDFELRSDKIYVKFLRIAHCRGKVQVRGSISCCSQEKVA